MGGLAADHYQGVHLPGRCHDHHCVYDPGRTQNPGLSAGALRTEPGGTVGPFAACGGRDQASFQGGNQRFRGRPVPVYRRAYDRDDLRDPAVFRGSFRQGFRRGGAVRSIPGQIRSGGRSGRGYQYRHPVHLRAVVHSGFTAWCWRGGRPIPSIPFLAGTGRPLR